MYSVEWFSGESSSAAFRMVWGSLQRLPDDGPWFEWLSLIWSLIASLQFSIHARCFNIWQTHIRSRKTNRGLRTTFDKSWPSLIESVLCPLRTLVSTGHLRQLFQQRTSGLQKYHRRNLIVISGYASIYLKVRLLNMLHSIQPNYVIL